MRRVTTVLLSTAVVVSPLVACGTGGGGDPAFPEDTARQTAANVGEWDLVLTDVRLPSTRASTGSCWSSRAQAPPAGQSTTSRRQCSTAAAKRSGSAAARSRATRRCSPGSMAAESRSGVIALSDPARLVVDVVDEGAD
jgi:hypothetical protein